MLVLLRFSVPLGTSRVAGPVAAGPMVVVPAYAGSIARLAIVPPLAVRPAVPERLAAAIVPETMVVEPPESVVAPVTSPARLTKPPCTPRLVIAAVLPMARGLPAALSKMPLASTVALVMTRFVRPLAPVTPLLMREAADRAARGRDAAAGERSPCRPRRRRRPRCRPGRCRPSCRSRRRWPPGCRRRKPGGAGHRAAAEGEAAAGEGYAAGDRAAALVQRRRSASEAVPAMLPPFDVRRAAGEAGAGSCSGCRPRWSRPTGR